MKVRYSAEATSYYGEVARGLVDLPAAVRADLLEDLMAHLNEVAAEGTALDLRLGAPSAYAAELRSAAGYPPAQTQPVAAPWSRSVLLVAAAVKSVDRALGRLLGFRDLAQVCAALRPAWWLLRGYVAGMLVVGGLFGWRHGLVPRAESIDGNSPSTAVFVGCLFVAAVTVLSVRVGRWSERWSLEYKLGLGIVDVVLVLLALVNLSVVDQSARSDRGVIELLRTSDQVASQTFTEPIGMQTNSVDAEMQRAA
jgi:uncharacterized membrane protein